MTEAAWGGRDPSLIELILKSAVVHTATYSLMGILAYNAFGYADAFSSGTLAHYMRPTSDPVVMMAPLIQPVRGAVFGVVFYLLRDSLFTPRFGWLTMWVMLGLVGIVDTFAAAPGSIEGALFTQLSFKEQFGPGLIEIYGQALLLSLGVFYWVRQPRNLWLGVGVSVVALGFILATIAGLILVPRS